jgi:uncharacterized membrane protein
MEIIRLVTVHPALVHFTIGALPIIVLSYGLAWLRRSERWTFAGDVALFVTAILTLFVAGFGLVSYLVLDWPGGLGPWPLLHLIFGLATASLLAGFALSRARARRQRAASGGKALSAAAAIAVIALFTGWIGGEVLVFRSGIAVLAAADGALAPPPWRAAVGDPDDLHDAMERLRGHWAVTETEIARMLVAAPSEERFDAVAHHAGHMRRVGQWMVRQGEGAAEPIADGGFAAELSAMARVFDDRARAVQERARAGDIAGLAAAAGEVSTSCASCHLHLRWNDRVPHEH